MLKAIDPLLTPDLLYVLRAMGHGDEIAIVDANYPAQSAGPDVVRLDAADATRTLDAVLSVLPLDTFVAEACWRMEVVGERRRRAADLRGVSRHCRKARRPAVQDRKSRALRLLRAREPMFRDRRHGRAPVLRQHHSHQGRHSPGLRRRSEKPFDPAVAHEDLLGRRRARQSRHGHDVAHQHDDEARARAQADLADRRDMAARRAEQGRVGGKRILRLGDADRQIAVSGRLQFVELRADASVGGDVGGAVDLARDDARLLPQRRRVGVERAKRRAAKRPPARPRRARAPPRRPSRAPSGRRSPPWRRRSRRRNAGSARARRRCRRRSGSPRRRRRGRIS